MLCGLLLAVRERHHARGLVSNAPVELHKLAAKTKPFMRRFSLKVLFLARQGKLWCPLKPSRVQPQLRRRVEFF